jgi:D-amino-acid dehydrogenase
VNRVVVVGGGISGLCVAYFLREAGVAVQVLEARRVGSGASWGNAGWVTPAQAGPLPEPGLLGYGVRALVDPRSALYFQPRQLARMLPWLVGFARRCNEADYRRGRIALGEISQGSIALLEGMAAEGIPIELQRLPLLVAATDARHARTFLTRLEPVARLGFKIPDRLLSQAEVLALEPALTDAVGAGFVIEPHCTVNPQAVIGGLRDRLTELGVEILEGSELSDIDLDGGRVAALRTSTGRFRCDSVVIATGAWLGRVGRLFGVRLPVQAGKGYSFEVRPRRMPRHALILLEPHVGCSPFGERLRIAGTMEFSGLNSQIDRRRIRSIIRGAGQMLDPWTDLDPDSVWCGLRPIAPDGLPIIDRHPRLSNVFFAGAYSMLGMTLAAPAAQALVSFMLTGQRPPALSPFQATRFSCAVCEGCANAARTFAPESPICDPQRRSSRAAGR